MNLFHGHALIFMTSYKAHRHITHPLTTHSKVTWQNTEISWILFQCWISSSQKNSCNSWVSTLNHNIYPLMHILIILSHKTHHPLLLRVDSDTRNLHKRNENKCKFKNTQPSPQNFTFSTMRHWYNLQWLQRWNMTYNPITPETLIQLPTNELKLASL